MSGGRFDTALTTFAPNTFHALPGILLAVAVLSFNFLGDALRGQLDPRTRLELGLKMRIGVVSDTHGLYRPQVAVALAGVERILHLGDVGKPSVLEELAKIAPVTAVRGNVDRSGACAELPETDVVLIADRYVYMLHDLNTLHLDPAAGKFAAVLFGHSHIPNFYTRKGVLYFNPGSCGPRRFQLPITVGLLTVSKDGQFEAKVVALNVGL